MKYLCGGRMFNTLEEATRYANFIHRVSRIVVSITEEV